MTSQDRLERARAFLALASLPIPEIDWHAVFERQQEAGRHWNGEQWVHPGDIHDAMAAAYKAVRPCHLGQCITSHTHSLGVE